MIISDEIISKIADLSKIEIHNIEKELMRAELGAVIEYMDLLCTLDTDEVEAFSDDNQAFNVLRYDKVNTSYDREELLICAPIHNEENFIVPQAFD